MNQQSPSVAVLMAVYNRDNPSHFADALDSLCPFAHRLNSVVLVADGPLTPELEVVIEQRLLVLKILLVRLTQSIGLGGALNEGLYRADSDFVLRMDSDDLSRAERLEVLLQRLDDDPKLDVIGSHIAEFNIDPARPHAERRMPLTHDEIARRMRNRSMMNHVSCLLRRQKVIEAGGYVGGSGFSEDWWLWVRLLLSGAYFANVDLVLVDVRVGNGFIGRRRGWTIFRQDLVLLRLMVKNGFITWHQAAGLACIKLLQRKLPAAVVKKVYSAFRHIPRDLPP